MNPSYRDEFYANKVLFGYTRPVQILLEDAIERRFTEAIQAEAKKIMGSLGVAFTPLDPWVVIENRMKKAKVGMKWIQRADIVPGGEGFVMTKEGVEKAVLIPFLDDVDNRVKVRVTSKL